MDDFDSVLKTQPREFSLWLRKEFIEDIPLTFDTYEDLQKIGNLIGVTANRYAYLASLLSYTKAVTRQLKRSECKSTYEDMVDRKEAIQNAVDTLKLQYQSLSRLITIRQEINQELRMNGIN